MAPDFRVLNLLVGTPVAAETGPELKDADKGQFGQSLLMAKNGAGDSCRLTGLQAAGRQPIPPNERRRRQIPRLR